MKKILLITNVLTLVLLYTSGFTNKKPTAQNEGGDPCSTVSLDNKNPITGISFNTAKDMARLYRANQWDTLNHHQPFKDTRSVWFSLDKLKSFIAEIDMQMCKEQCGKKLDLGVRIYEAAYPDSFELKKSSPNGGGYYGVDNKYGKYMTLFMVPTYYDSLTNLQIDFDPRNKGKNFCRPTPLKDLISPDKIYAAQANTRISNLGQYTTLQPEPDAQPAVAANAMKKIDSKIPASTPQPPAIKYSLILSTIEAQIFYSEKNKMLMKTSIQSAYSIMNHGNTIPPDVDNGTAF